VVKGSVVFDTGKLGVEDRSTIDEHFKEFFVRSAIVDQLRGKPRPLGRGGCQRLQYSFSSPCVRSQRKERVEFQAVRRLQALPQCCHRSKL
jgi:hypothetical protein